MKKTIILLAVTALFASAFALGNFVPVFAAKYKVGKDSKLAKAACAVCHASAKGGKDFTAAPLSANSMASRLSYFLWSSMPDAELQRHANAGDLNNPKVLLAQTRRMLKDQRVTGLATEFTGNWLGFRLFETNNSVDRERFPTFNDDLREAMFQEPIHFMQDTISNDRSVLDLVYGDYTFVNPVLARHYGYGEGGERRRA